MCRRSPESVPIGRPVPPVPWPSGRPGITLLELLLAITLTVLVVGSMAAVTKGVQMSFEYSEGYGAVTQHARVALDRIARSVQAARANESFPGFLVLSENEGAWTFPDTLVVWRPSGTPANPQGLPLFKELVIYAPDPADPSQLVEITVPSDTRQVPPIADEAGWASAVRVLKASASSQKVVLTGLLRTVRTTNTTRGAVRFASRLTPSETEWTSYVQGTLGWNQLRWPRGLQGSRWGLRQAWLRTELQLQPQAQLTTAGGSTLSTAVFFGSATVEYSLARRN